MELKTETGKLVETYKKYLNDDIHELPACRISKHSEQNCPNHYSRFAWKIYLNFTNSKMCLHQVLNLPMWLNGVYWISELHMFLQGAEGGHDIPPNYQ